MSDHFCKASQPEVSLCHYSPSAPRHLCHHPPPPDPHVEQKERERDQHKPVSRFVRRCPPAHLASAPITALNPKLPAILLAHLLWRPVQPNQDEDHPVGLPRVAASPLRRREDAADGQLDRLSAMLWVREGIGCAITLPSVAQGAVFTVRFISRTRA